MALARRELRIQVTTQTFHRLREKTSMAAEALQDDALINWQFFPRQLIDYITRQSKRGAMYPKLTASRIVNKQVFVDADEVRHRKIIEAKIPRYAVPCFR